MLSHESPEAAGPAEVIALISTCIEEPAHNDDRELGKDVDEVPEEAGSTQRNPVAVGAGIFLSSPSLRRPNLFLVAVEAGSPKRHPVAVGAGSPGRVARHQRSTHDEAMAAADEAPGEAGKEPNGAEVAK